MRLSLLRRRILGMEKQGSTVKTHTANRPLPPLLAYLEPSIARNTMNTTQTDASPKLVPAKRLKEYGITYGPDYIRKLVAENRFPAPIKLSASLRVWREADILAWSAEKMGLAPEPEPSAAAKLWGSHILGMMPARLVSHENLPVSYTKQHLLRLEKSGKFPKRVHLSARRVAWSAEAVEAWLVERGGGRMAHA